MSFHGVNRFDRNQGSGRSRDIWLPNGTKAINEYSLEQSDINIKNSTTPHSNICSMDRPSHWGSKPKCTRKPERRTRMKANEKNPKSSRESFGFGERSLVSTAKPKLVMAGMIAQFPPSKISTEAGKLDSMSFKPLWLQSVTPNVDFDMHRTNLRDFNVDEIQEVRGEAMVKNVSMVTSAAEDPKENRAIVTNTSPQASRQLSLSSGGHKDRKIDKVMDKDIDSFNEGHSVRQIDWRSPSTKVLKGGKKVRSKAGSLKAIYQKLTRNIEEKECRMLNITSLDDPQHPRNRALFYLDITVVEEKEIWPFRILSAYISKIERKQSRPPRKSGADVLLFYPSLSGDGDGTLNLHNNEEPDTVGDEYRHQEYLQPINVANKNDYDRSKNLDEADTRTSLTAAADSNERNERVEAYEMAECRLSPSNYQNALPHSDVLVASAAL